MRRATVQRAVWNGVPYQKNFITHADLLQGGELVLEMGAEPSATWDQTAGPGSMSSLDQKPCYTADKSDSAGLSQPTQRNLFDNNSLTTLTLTPETDAVALQWSEPQTVHTLTLTNDVLANAPQTLVLEAARPGQPWVVISREDQIHWTWDHELRVFHVQAPGSYTNYRLAFPGIGNPSTITLGEIELIADGVCRPLAASPR